MTVGVSGSRAQRKHLIYNAILSPTRSCVGTPQPPQLGKVHVLPMPDRGTLSTHTLSEWAPQKTQLSCLSMPFSQKKVFFNGFAHAHDHHVCVDFSFCGGLPFPIRAQILPG